MIFELNNWVIYICAGVVMLALIILIIIKSKKSSGAIDKSAGINFNAHRENNLLPEEEEENSDIWENNQPTRDLNEVCGDVSIEYEITYTHAGERIG